MPSNHLILCHPLLLPSIFPSIRVFSSNCVWMWELDYKESWVPKNWCFWTVVLEKTLESPLGCKEIQPVHPKGDQSWVFIGRTDVEAETPILWQPDVKSWLIWKDPDSGKGWRQEEKGTTEDGCHHRLNGHGFEWTLGVGDGQGGLISLRMDWFDLLSVQGKKWPLKEIRILHMWRVQVRTSIYTTHVGGESCKPE